MRDRAVVETEIPARLDRMPWGSFHTLVVRSLGVTWILDGLEVTLAGALSGALKESAVLKFSNTDVGIVGEYAAINSKIQELIPARVRGWTDLVINGSF